MEIEHFFTCPYCWQTISMVLELMTAEQSYVEDCEVCCNPIQIRYTTECFELDDFAADSIEQWNVLMKKERIDKLIHELGFSDSLKNAQALIMSGKILVNEQRVEKPSELFSAESIIRIKGEADKHKYVGRGGLKLEKALEEFHIQPSEYICLDVGASTGGFTDCLLQNGVKKVVSVDVGTNQIVWKLRIDKRVEIRENTNARYLKPEDFSEKFDLIVMDVSFISVTKIFPALLTLLKDGGKIITLIKPQFEVAKEEVGKGGIVRETEKHEKVLTQVNQAAARIGLYVSDKIESPILGADGNKEFLVLYEKRKEN